MFYFLIIAYQMASTRKVYSALLIKFWKPILDTYLIDKPKCAGTGYIEA